jgi:hypothetical protein
MGRQSRTKQARKQGLKKPKQKPKFKINTYSFLFHTSDGYLNTIEIEARSLQEATERFNFFSESLELYIGGVRTKQLEKLISSASAGGNLQ